MTALCLNFPICKTGYMESTDHLERDAQMSLQCQGSDWVLHQLRAMVAFLLLFAPLLHLR